MIKLNFAGSFALIFGYWIKLDTEVIYAGIIAAAAVAAVVCYLKDANKRVYRKQWTAVDLMINPVLSQGGSK